jgi:hypothetical protein
MCPRWLECVLSDTVKRTFGCRGFDAMQKVQLLRSFWNLLGGLRWGSGGIEAHRGPPRPFASHPPAKSIICAMAAKQTTAQAALGIDHPGQSRPDAKMADVRAPEAQAVRIQSS